MKMIELLLIGSEMMMIVHLPAVDFVDAAGVVAAVAVAVLVFAGHFDGSVHRCWDVRLPQLPRSTHCPVNFVPF